LPHKQRSRLTYIAEAEKNWGHSLLDVVHESIRPHQREEGDVFNYATVNKRELENDPRNWSDHLLRQLSHLSRRTEGEADRARALLEMEVSDRQTKTGAPYRNMMIAKELLRGDVQRINNRLDPVPQPDAEPVQSSKGYSKSKEGPAAAPKANLETAGPLGRKRKRDKSVDLALRPVQDMAEVDMQQRILQLEAEAGKKLAGAVMLKMELAKRQNATSE